MRDENKDDNKKGQAAGEGGEDEAEETITLREEGFDDTGVSEGDAEPYRDE
jgi:hypothetical protein